MAFLVTGAAGFFGSNLAQDCAHWWSEMIGVTRDGVAPGYHRGIAADLTDPSSVNLLAAQSPNVIVHAAALASVPACETDPRAAYRANVLATQHVAQAAALCGARLVYISTDAVFDGATGNYTEQDATNPQTVYGKTKLLGEQVALATVPTALIARINIFGWSPRGDKSVLEFFVNALRSGTAVNGYTDYRVSSGYVRHVITTMRMLIAASATGVYHVAATDALSKYEFGMAVADAFGLNGSLINPVTAPRPADLSLSCDKAVSLIGPRPTQQDGILAAASCAPALS